MNDKGVTHANIVTGTPIKNKTILVTGAIGFIGSNLVKRLVKEFKEIKKLKWNQIVKIINEVNDIDSATKKLYLDTIKDLIWVIN